MTNYIEPSKLIPGYAFRHINYRLKDEAEYKQEVLNARYEGEIRSDFSAPKISRYTCDRMELVRLV